MDRRETSSKKSAPDGPDDSSKKKLKKKHAVDRTGDHSGHLDVNLLEAEFEKLCRGV
jgi:hypothetical protein